MAIVVVATLAVFGGYLWLRTSLPSLDGDIRLAGLRDRAEVIYDANGIPHIRASTVEDAYFVLGFVHARDRLFQMDFVRRLGSGTLSEVIGERALPLDRMARTLGIQRSAERILAGLPRDAVAVLEAYRAGINAWLATRSGALPPEFVLLGYEPKPWSSADLLMRSRLTVASLVWNWKEEALRGALAARLSPAQFADLFPEEDGGVPPTVNEVWNNSKDAENMFAALLDAVPREEWKAAPASNAWAVGGGRTASGLPLLASDPHLRLDAPTLWYLAHMEAPGLSLTGATLPGTPVFVLGHNGAIAWAGTSTGSDVQDFFIERISKNNPDHYDTPEGSRPFEVRIETIAVKGQQPRELTVRETRHGPVVSDLAPGFVDDMEHRRVIALSSTLLRDDDMTFLAFVRLNRARNWHDFRAAMKYLHSPQQNMTYADVEGNIGFLASGRVPIRRSGDGWIPWSGWTGERDWVGFVPFEELPSTLNPRSEIVVNANHRIVSRDFPWFLARRWSPHYRAARIHEHIEQETPRTLGTETALQHDEFSGAADAVVPLLLELVASDRLDEKLKRALASIRHWDRRMSRDSAAPLIFTAWLGETNRGLYADELGEFFEHFFDLRPRTVVHMLKNRRMWCDNVDTPGREDCRAIVNKALSRALDLLERMYGEDMENWQWGNAHQAIFGHIIFGRIPVLKSLADIRIDTGGGSFTVNRGRHTISDPDQPFASVHGSAYRAVYDLADLSKSLFSVGAGPSGNFLSWRYDNLTRSWRDGVYVRIAQTRVEAIRNALGVLTISPEP